MRKTDFQQFSVGSVFNGVELAKQPRRCYDRLTVTYPSRLEAMALDPAKIADNNNLIYEAGQIDFTVALYKQVTVELDPQSSAITISAATRRQPLVRHAALIMRSALGFTEGLKIHVDDPVHLRHCGLGSSSSLIAATAAAINELFGCPIAPQQLVRYCAQNHGEEIDNDPDHLVPVQCIGGSAVCGHFEGGIIVLAAQATPIAAQRIAADVKVVIGIPSDFSYPDSQQLMQAELANIGSFKQSGAQFGDRIAYRLVHEVLPALAEGDLKPCKRLIFDYRWDMGSIKNCSFVYPRMLAIAESLRPLRDDPEVQIIALSSVGPGFFALTTNVAKVKRLFTAHGLTTHVTKIHNGTYEVKGASA